MAKVFHFTLMLEIDDGEAPPDDWNWPELLTQIPELKGFSLVACEQRPFSSMEEDPTFHTHH